MSLPDLLHACDSLGVRLSLRLVVGAPAGTLDDKHKAAIEAYQDALLVHLALQTLWTELAPEHWGPAVGDPERGVIIDRPNHGYEAKHTKVKYACPGCAANVSGKPDMAIACLACGKPFTCGDDPGDGESTITIPADPFGAVRMIVERFHDDQSFCGLLQAIAMYTGCAPPMEETLTPFMGLDELGRALSKWPSDSVAWLIRLASKRPARGRNAPAGEMATDEVCR
jgi:hypothetical protein